MVSSSVSYTTIDIFHLSLRRIGFSGGKVCPSAVPELYIRLFHKYKIKDWTEFPKQAAKMYVEGGSINLSRGVYADTKRTWKKEDSYARERAKFDVLSTSQLAVSL